MRITLAALLVQIAGLLDPDRLEIVRQYGYGITVTNVVCRL
ncbi:MAG: hypothetical protein U0930_08585 [Pirellulales bacterium]